MYSQFVSFIVNIDVSNHSVNAQQTKYVRKSISSVRSSEIKAMIQLGLNMLVLIPSFAILDWRITVNGRETCDRIIFLQNTSNRVHLTVRWVNIQARMQASQKGGYIFSPVHIHLSSHIHAITIIQVIVEV